MWPDETYRPWYPFSTTVRTTFPSSDVTSMCASAYVIPVRTETSMCLPSGSRSGHPYERPCVAVNAGIGRAEPPEAGTTYTEWNCPGPPTGPGVAEVQSSPPAPQKHRPG